MSDRDNKPAILLDELGNQAPSARLWLIGGAAALFIHIIGALPFLPAPTTQMLGADFEDEGIGVTLAPMIAPPDAAPPEELPPEEETPAIEERASDSPPPAPPPEPREIPDIPDIRPQAVPDIWFGPGGGQMSLEDYLTLGQWHRAARQQILNSLTYPIEARRRGITGRAVVIITVERSGRISDWSFRTKTGQIILDREISHSMNSVRRLPKLPPDAAYDQISFTVPIRFELVYNEGDPTAPPPPTGGPRPPAPGQLSLSQLRFCAQSADQLGSSRQVIEAQRNELETLRSDYEAALQRYERQRRQPPRRVERQLDQYNEKVEAYQALVETFQQQAGAFQRACGQGTTTWEHFVQACSPYIGRNNPYCEAYGDLWARLSAQR